MRRSILAAGLIVALALATGCSFFQSSSEPAEGAGAGTTRGMGAVGRYYDFDDIQVPLGLKLNKDKSILFNVGSFKAGLMVFSDNLEVESLINFFIDSMTKDNWVLKSSFKYPQVALFFAKRSKTCVINIIESTFSTTVQIWVAPALESNG